jgi:hypothetical protein
MCEAEQPAPQFKSELDHFKNEVINAIWLHVVPQTIGLLAAGPGVRRALNQAPAFWNLSAAAHQQALIVTLGRLFDQQAPHNAHTVIRLASRYRLEIFGKPALAARKRAEAANADDWLEEYLGRAHEPTIEELRNIRRVIEEQHQIYQQRFDPIRDRYVAHRATIQPDAIAEVFRAAEIMPLEKLLATLSSVHRVLEELYFNGTHPVLNVEEFNVRELAQMPFDDLPFSDVGRAVRDVRQCVDQLLRGTPGA